MRTLPPQGDSPTCPIGAGLARGFKGLLRRFKECVYTFWGETILEEIGKWRLAGNSGLIMLNKQAPCIVVAATFRKAGIRI